MNDSNTAPCISDELERDLRHLYEDYTDTVDSQDLETWPSYFTEDCLYQVISRENHEAGLPHATIHCVGLAMVRDRALATRECTVYEPRYLRHFLQRLRVTDIVNEEAHVRGGFLLIESVSDEAPRILLTGHYLDVVVRTPEGLKFRQRLCVYDNFRIHNSLVFPV